jgi:predicted AAA+ superfamily ATPase
MGEGATGKFIVGDDLNKAVKALTADSSGIFERRDFVKALIEYCLDGNHSAQIGILYGLRSTGKTVGMLQAAQELLGQGFKAAYARFNYGESGLRDANPDIMRLAEEGYTHFFVDEAPYLNGFMTGSAEWADTFAPIRKIKIVVSGTDSFELWLAMNRALFHRFVRISANRNTFPEYKRVWGKGYGEYKKMGGIFISGIEKSANETAQPAPIERFIESAVVDNLIHTLEHCNDNSGCANYYYDWLYALDKQVIFKGAVSILESTAEAALRKSFIKDADGKNIPNLGIALSNWPDPEKRGMKERIAEQLGVYKNFRKIEDPAGTIEALTAFLVKIGCLVESASGPSEYSRQKTLYFAHSALMNYALEETAAGILSIDGIDRGKLISALNQAAEGALSENIVHVHAILSAREGDKVFRYRDADAREIDVAIINREHKILRLIEAKSKSAIDCSRVFQNEAKRLFAPEALESIGVDGSYSVTRIIAYNGESVAKMRGGDALLLVNTEELLSSFWNLDALAEKMCGPLLQSGGRNAEKGE